MPQEKLTRPASVLPFQVKLVVMGGFLYVSQPLADEPNQLRFYPTNKPGSDQYFVARSTDEASLRRIYSRFASWLFFFVNVLRESTVASFNKRL